MWYTSQRWHTICRQICFSLCDFAQIVPSTRPSYNIDVYKINSKMIWNEISGIYLFLNKHYSIVKLSISYILKEH